MHKEYDQIEPPKDRHDRIDEMMAEREFIELFNETVENQVDGFGVLFSHPNENMSHHIIQSRDIREYDGGECEIVALLPFCEQTSGTTVIFLRQLHYGLTTSQLEAYAVGVPSVQAPLEDVSRLTVPAIFDDKVTFLDRHDLWGDYRTSFRSAAELIDQHWEAFDLLKGT